MKHIYIFEDGTIGVGDDPTSEDRVSVAQGMLSIVRIDIVSTETNEVRALEYLPSGNYGELDKCEKSCVCSGQEYHHL